MRETERGDARTRLLMSTPGVGTIVALTFASAIDDPGRFKSSRAVGAPFGLTPKKYQSGETDVSGRISKIGDGSVRTALYEAANIILTRPVKGSSRSVGAWRWREGPGHARPRWRWRASWPAWCTGCWSTAHRSSPSRPRRRRSRSLPRPEARGRGKKRRDIHDFRGRRHPAPGATVPSPGRWNRPGRNPPSGAPGELHPAGNRASVDRPTCSSSNPIRWRPSADPGQKRDPGDRTEAQKGIDQGSISVC